MTIQQFFPDVPTDRPIYAVGITSPSLEGYRFKPYVYRGTGVDEIEEAEKRAEADRLLRCKQRERARQAKRAKDKRTKERQAEWAKERQAERAKERQAERAKERARRGRKKWPVAGVTSDMIAILDELDQA